MLPILKYRGSTMLKVIGIIMIVFGAVGIVGGAITAATGRFLVSMYGLDEAATGFYAMLGLVIVVLSIINLVFGVFARRYCNKADKANLLLGLGIAQIAIDVVYIIFDRAILEQALYYTNQILAGVAALGVSADIMPFTAGADSYSFPVLVFVLPVLYIIGALLNRRPPIEIAPPYYGYAQWPQYPPQYPQYPQYTQGQQGQYQQNQQGYSSPSGAPLYPPPYAQPGQGGPYPPPVAPTQSDSPYAPGYVPPDNGRQ